MTFAQVAVDAPLGFPRTLSYAVPPSLVLELGHVVWVPLGPRPVHGVVFELGDQPPDVETRPIGGVLAAAPPLWPYQLALAEWISSFYRSTLFEAAALMLPPGFRRKIIPLVALTPGTSLPAGPLPPQQQRVLELLARLPVVEVEKLKGAVGPHGEGALRALLAKGLVTRQWRWERPRVGPKYLATLRLSAPLPVAREQLAGLSRGRASRQVALLEHLAAVGALPASQARKEFGAPAVQGLLQKGVAILEEVRQERDPLRGRAFLPEVEVQLTQAQAAAVQAITGALNAPQRAQGVFLLQGVTGSGKTEVYLEALAHCLRLGKRAILLVPELSLTPQFVRRLGARFPGRLGLLHSGLSLGEQYDSWWRVRRGDFGVVLGARSALFAPQPDLGLIIVDEEHEWTYKQEDASPRYHARDVALKLAELTGCVVVLGSATPDVGSYHLALRGEYRLLELPGRVGSGPGGAPRELPLASVEVVDMGRELREGNRSILSRLLQQAMGQALAGGHQAILFLNRRGAATHVQCRDCGHPLRCRRCSITLAFHATEGRLVCHQCNRRVPVPQGCPRCLSPRIRFLGIGTQRVAEEAERLFHVATLRWDRDAARERDAYYSLMARFSGGEAQVLVGTQMIAKGLHLPRVTLVGVVLADVGLYLPDFRAGERAFQLLCQVAGRAGRGEQPGQVIIQTYSLEHYAIQAAARQDYRAFYEQEMAFRRQHLYPPVQRLARLLYQHTNEEACQQGAECLALELRRQQEAQGLAEVDLLGPAPAYPARVRGRYRWQVLVRAPDPLVLLDRVHLPQGWTVDVDPVSLA